MNKQKTIADLKALKKQKKPITMLTAYDASFAQLFESCGIDCLLVGDSLSQTIQGQPSTVFATIEDMCYHTKCVRRGAPNTFIITDYPFPLSLDKEVVLNNCANLIRAGANMVKIEGDDNIAPIVSYLNHAGIAVCAHLGLRPQQFNLTGKYASISKQDAIDKAIEDGKHLEENGASMLLFENIKFTNDVSSKFHIPTIGIGSGNTTDGQVLVSYDILGLSTYMPPFAKNFLSSSLKQAVQDYIQQVISRTFPS